MGLAEPAPGNDYFESCLAIPYCTLAGMERNVKRPLCHRSVCVGVVFVARLSRTHPAECGFIHGVHDGLLSAPAADAGTILSSPHNGSAKVFESPAQPLAPVGGADGAFIRIRGSH